MFRCLNRYSAPSCEYPSSDYSNTNKAISRGGRSCKEIGEEEKVYGDNVKLINGIYINY